VIKLDGPLYIQNDLKGSIIKGFSKKDFNILMQLGRQVYKIKTRKKRILKKYAKKLINESIRKYIVERTYSY
jgi:hypothetical protein